MSKPNSLIKSVLNNFPNREAIIKVLKNVYLFAVIFSIIFFKAHSQENYMDYAITDKNDTIYGLIRETGLNKIALYSKNQNPELDGIKFYENNLKHVNELRWNGTTFKYQAPVYDGIYQSNTIPQKKGYVTKSKGNFFSLTPKSPDYVVVENDTIYGEISNPILGKLILKNDENKKYKVKINDVKAYRFKNEVFVRKTKERVALFDDKIAFLKLLLTGNNTLYQYEVSSNQNLAMKNNIFSQNIFYFIENNNEMTLIRSINFKNKMRDLLSNDKIMLERLNNDEYSFENIYHIINYVNKKK